MKEKLDKSLYGKPDYVWSYRSNPEWDMSEFGRPFYFFFYYVPTKHSAEMTDESAKVQQAIWDFKAGRKQEAIAKLVENRLRDLTYIPDLTFVCVPASTIKSNETRFGKFSQKICRDLRIHNGFNHIQITKEKEPRHLNNSNEKAEYALDLKFFYMRNVILFDDVVSSGSSMRDLSNKFSEAQVNVVGYMSLCRTYNEFFVNHNCRHPYSGNRVLKERTHNPLADLFPIIDD